MHATMTMTDPDKHHKTGRLSPHATPFQPRSSSVIYNEGVPSLMMPDHDLVHGIQDEALDEVFPPDAQEAAELEAVQIFVETLAALSLLEEREEAARNSFAGVAKRWETRRKEGLVGKPHAAAGAIKNPWGGGMDHPHTPRNSMVYSTNNNGTNGALVSYEHAHKQHMMDNRMKAKEVMARRSEPRHNNKKIMHNQLRLPIQQPRKQN